MSIAPAPLWLDQNSVLGLLPDIDCLSVMRETFRAFGNKTAIQPPQLLAEFSGGQGDFIAYSGILETEGVFGVKLSPYIVREGGAKVTAATLLMDMKTGAPLFLCDSLALTTERTAATTALAVDLLSRPEADDLAIIGSGPVALAHLRQVLPLRKWNRIRVHSRSIASSKAEFAAKLGPMSVTIEFVTERDAAVTGADVVMLCTSSGTPVIGLEDLEPKMLVTSISTNIPGAHEVPPAALQRMNVFCDAKTTTPRIAGDMRMATELGWSENQILGDLGDLVCARATPVTPAKCTYFRSMGLGLEDIGLAMAIYKRFLERSAVR